jgi:uncharacterized membrane protein HdeD (DUF308 family)
MEPANAEAGKTGLGQIGFWITLLRGIFAISLGLALLVQPDKTRPVLLNFMGFYWLASGIVSIRWGISSRRPRLLAVLAGVIGVLAGLVTVTRRLMFRYLEELIVVYLLGGVIFLTGVAHMAGGFREEPGADRRWSWFSFLLGVFEVVLGGLLLLAPLELGPAVVWAAGIWALLGGLILIRDARRQRAQARRAR